MSYIPVIDRLGSRVLTASGDSAQNLGITAIPANESVVLCMWTRGHEPSLTTGAWWGLRLDKGGTDIFSFRGGTGAQMETRISDGVGQSLYAPYQHGRDAFYAAVIDRDNTDAHMFLDGTLTDSQNLTQDPDLTAVLRAYLEDNGATWDHTTWRVAVMSITNGSCPSSADLSAMLKKMVNPDAAMPAEMTALIGTSYSDYRPGEGLYGSATVTDIGPNGDDLTWQGGVTIEDVRTRARTPVRKPRYDCYTLMPGYTATLAGQDYGFAVQPVVMRWMLGNTTFTPSGDTTVAQFGIGAGTRYIRLRWFANGTKRLHIQDGGGQTTDYLIGDQLDGGDLWIVKNGATGLIYYCGQHIATATGTAEMDFSGVCTVSLNGIIDVCRLAAWNPATVPATLAAEIRQCAMNVEMDPASLGVPLVDFPLNSNTLPLATSTTVTNQGSGGGTLTLSAQRSTSCKTLFASFNP